MTEGGPDGAEACERSTHAPVAGRNDQVEIGGLCAGHEIGADEAREDELGQDCERDGSDVVEITGQNRDQKLEAEKGEQEREV
ncbi:MAG: hypothetical protein ACRDKZ_14060 [Actinomycetota bacterium]